MIYIRFAAVVLLVLCGGACGIYNADKLRRRVELCTEAEKAMRLFEALIRTSGADVYRLIAALKAERPQRLGFVYSLPDSFSSDCDIRQCWRELLMRENDIPDEEKNILIDLGNMLGTTDIEGQLSCISAQLVLMSSLREQRAAEYRQKGRLYRSLGVMAGISVGIIMI